MSAVITCTYAETLERLFIVKCKTCGNTTAPLPLEAAKNFKGYRAKFWKHNYNKITLTEVAKS